MSQRASLASFTPMGDPSRIGRPVSRRRLGVALAGLGLVGVTSLALLPVERLIAEPLPVSVSALRLLSLINPALLVLLAA